MVATRPPVSLVAPAPSRIPAAAPNDQQPATTPTRRNGVQAAVQSHQKGAVASANQPQMDALQQPGRGTASGAIGGVLGGIASQSPQLKVGKAAALPAPASQPVPVPPATTVNNATTVNVGGPVENVPQPAPVADALTIDGRALDRAQNALFQSPLPSHVAVLSMATNVHQRVAIDTQNHLFFSNDDGRHWKTVPSQWKGRAVTIALASPTAYGNGAPILRVSSRPAATASSTLFGTVTDSSGAVIPSATVAATSSDARLVRSVQTDSHGQFRIDNIVPGSYRLEVQASGFVKRSTPIEVAASQQTSADVTLQVGSAAQTVQVQASPSPIATESPNVTQSIDAKRSSEPPAGPNASHFELKTDTGDRWTSVDGQIWKHE
jgi:hypothetical protein